MSRAPHVLRCWCVQRARLTDERLTAGLYRIGCQIEQQLLQEGALLSDAYRILATPRDGGLSQHLLGDG